MRKRIRILIGDLPRPKGAEEIIADVFGAWAAHPCRLMRMFPGWSVTHVPSGQKLGFCDNVSEHDAKTIAAALSKRIPSVEVRNHCLVDVEDEHVILATVAECLCEGSAP
jgi:hypothetical protein